MGIPRDLLQKENASGWNHVTETVTYPETVLANDSLQLACLVLGFLREYNQPPLQFVDILETAVLIAHLSDLMVLTAQCTYCKQQYVRFT